MNAHPDPDEWARDVVKLAREAAEKDPAQTACGEALLSDARSLLEYHADRYGAALAVIDGTPELARYRGTVEAEARGIGELLACMENGGWDDVQRWLSELTPGRLPPVKNAPPEEKARIADVRDGWKEALGELKKDFSRSAADVRRDAAAVLPVAGALMALVADFDAAYTDAKRRRGIVDFSDLEHLTLRLLRTPSGAPTALARELAESFEEILVDEYQDTNAVQDAIFASLARGNLFMVGDMKQSIYRFRLADPSIFLDKYRSYPDDAPEGMPRRVILSENYRSRPAVLDAANRVFAKLFSPALGELAYTEQEYLHPGRAFPEVTADTATELVLVGERLDGAGDAPDTADGSAAEEAAAEASAEAEYTAARIAAMVREGYPVAAKEGGVRPAQWGDFAILLRSFDAHAAEYAGALERRGIPAALANRKGNLFRTPEVELTVALLRCVDNPRQDIALAAAMRAPMFGFSADELAAVRVARPEGTFWEAVFAAADAARVPETLADAAREQPDAAVYARAAEKAKEMLDAFAELRAAAETMPLGRFLWHMATKLELFAYVAAMDSPAVRRENLYTLFSLAYRFENAGYRGLYRFLRQLRSLDERGGTAASDTAAEGAVRLMSVHKSKGLQFPIVFLCGCGGRFNMELRSAPVLLHTALGLGLRRREAERRIEYPTLAQSVIRRVLWREQLSEELRVLYVALTRAEEKLILTAAVRDPARTLDTYRRCTDPADCSPRALLGESRVLGWLLRALTAELGEDGRTREGDWRLVIADGAEPEASVPEEPMPEASVPEEPEACAGTWSGEALGWRYSYEDAVRIPSKLTATELSRGIPGLDDAEELPPLREELSRAAGENPDAVRRWKRPQFIEKRGLSPAERGTALHMAMQFGRYERMLTRFDCREELSRLVREAYLTQEQAEAVSEEKILRFFHSELGQRLRRSPEVRREFKFSLPVSPELYTEGPSALKKPVPGGDSVLLQGVIDCFFLEDGEYVIVDFKTDAGTPPARAMAHYRPQLEAYAHAVARITGRPVRECVLYLFSTGETASLCPEA